MPEKKPKDKPKKPPKHPEAALYKALRHRAQDATEFTLREYFETDGAAAGFSSSFGALTDMALAGPGGGSARDPDARLARDGRLLSVKRHRAVMVALRAIPQNALVLWAAYGDHRLPGEVYGPDYYGPFAGVALLTETAKREYGAEVGRREVALWAAEADARDGRLSEEAQERQRARDEQREAELQRVLDRIVAVEADIEEANEKQARPAAVEALFIRLRRLHAQEAELRANIDRMCPTLEPCVVAKQTALGKLKGATMGEWLRSGRSKAYRPAIRQEADAMLREARARFRVAFERAREKLRRRGKGIAKDVKRLREAIARAPLPAIAPITHTRAGLTQ